MTPCCFKSRPHLWQGRSIHKWLHVSAVVQPLWHSCYLCFRYPSSPWHQYVNTFGLQMTVGAHTTVLRSTVTASAPGMQWHSFSKCNPPSSLHQNSLATMVTCCTAWHAPLLATTKLEGPAMCLQLPQPNQLTKPARDMRHMFWRPKQDTCWSHCSATTCGRLWTHYFKQ